MATATTSARAWRLAHLTPHVVHVTLHQVLIYKVTADDMAQVPSGRFEVSFSSTPQPLRAGDYLATTYPESSEVFLSRNAEQIYLSQIIRSQEEMCR